MKFVKTIFFTLVLCFWASLSLAQTEEEKSVENSIPQEEEIPKKIKLKDQEVNGTYKSNLSIGIGINAVDDSGKKLSKININEDWNYSMPYVFSIEYFHDIHVSFALTASMNEYIEGKNIDNTGTIIKNYEASYLAIDFATKFYVRDFFHTARIDPFGFIGFGYTQIGTYKLKPFEESYLRDDLDHITIDEDGNYDIPAIGRVTLNVGLGFNYWFTRIWAINLNAAWKFGIPNNEFIKGPNSVSHQLQYTIGTHFLIF